MKPQAIVFTEHEPDTLDRLIKAAAKAGHVIHRGSDFLKFSAHEGASAVPTPKARKNVYGIKETEKTVQTFTERYNLADYLPEGT